MLVEHRCTVSECQHTAWRRIVPKLCFLIVLIWGKAAHHASHFSSVALRRAQHSQEKLTRPAVSSRKFGQPFSKKKPWKFSKTARPRPRRRPRTSVFFTKKGKKIPFRFCKNDKRAENGKNPSAENIKKRTVHFLAKP